MISPFQRLLLTFPLIVGSLFGCQSFEQIPSTVTPETTVSPTLTDPGFLTAIEEVTYREINQYRLSRNLPPLKLNPQVSQQARIHSERMATGVIPLGHDKFEERTYIINLTTPHQKAAENLATYQESSDPVQAIVKQWLKNADDLQNIEGNYDTTGIGVAQNGLGQYYFTQIFIKELPKPILKSPGLDESLPPEKNQDVLLNKADKSHSRFLISLEEEISKRVNEYRTSKKLPPLVMNAQISDVARQHSQAMANKSATFSHDGFEGRAKSVGVTVPYKTVGENLAYVKGYRDLVSVAVKGWINSPGHRKNMEGNFNLTGVGIAKNTEGEYYFTQLFVLDR